MIKSLPYRSDSTTTSANFPSTRYQGSKAKIVDWIWDNLKDLGFQTALDLFGGTGVVAYKFKSAGKQVAYNDLLKFNYYFALALIENSCTQLTSSEIDWLLQKQPGIKYPHFIEKNFSGIYFTDAENRWLDRTITNIRQLTDEKKFALAFFALAQACIIKRPYNLFHRKNLYLRLAEVERTFGNKSTWDRPFEDFFRYFAGEANNAVFDNGKKNIALNLDVSAAPTDFDLVYIDPPYISNRGGAVDYYSFYHFLEGLTIYDEWNKFIDLKSKHRRLRPRANPWTDKSSIASSFDKIFQRFRKSIIVLSYRNDGIPSDSELIELLGRYKKDIFVEYYGKYKYVLSTNNSSQEALIIGR